MPDADDQFTLSDASRDAAPTRTILDADDEVLERAADPTDISDDANDPAVANQATATDHDEEGGDDRDSAVDAKARCQRIDTIEISRQDLNACERIQPREKSDPKWIEHLRASIDAGRQLPLPIVVEDEDGARYFCSGHHTVEAMASDVIRVELRRGTRADAEEISLASNAENGKQLSGREKRYWAEWLLRNRRWSDRKIARHVGLAPRSVGRFRAAADRVGCDNVTSNSADSLSSGDDGGRHLRRLNRRAARKLLDVVLTHGAQGIADVILADTTSTDDHNPDLSAFSHELRELADRLDASGQAAGATLADAGPQTNTPTENAA
jgi:hypothetical protein